ncbi:MAG: hypothetical protein GY729_07790 [Desulfobacteraceae bacterium]|nr:hypothetical protein [Desulfobacteraceae bacterium]
MASSFLTRNSMLAGNMAANLAGILIFKILKNFGVSTPTEQADLIYSQTLWAYLPCALTLWFSITLYYELPIRSVLNKILAKEKIDPALKKKARQRILNEPFFLLSLDAFFWGFAAFLCPFVILANGITGKFLLRIFCQISFIGVINVTIAFFILERILRWGPISLLFPKGGLYKTPGTLRIKIKTRLLAMLIGINIIPLVTLFLMSKGTYTPEISDPELLVIRQAEMLLIYRRAVQLSIISFLSLAFVIVFLVTTSLTRPFGNIIKRLKEIKKGNFEGKINVLSNDEIGYTSDMINEMAEGLKERELIKDAFGKYVAKEVRDEVLSGRIPLDGEQKEVTVLFSDLRDFTPMIEQYEPKESVRLMNLYFKEMAWAIQENNGLVLQFIGDEIYAVFGAPIYDEHHSTHAVKAAISMEQRLGNLNLELEEQNLPALEHGIGIHSGNALAANMGSPDRMSYLLVGNTVNIASRLQGLNKEFQTRTILSQATYDELDVGQMEGSQFLSLGPVAVKGIKEKINMFSLDVNG